MLLGKSEEELDGLILRLTYSCPIDHQDSNCPFREMKTFEFKTKNKWISWLSIAEKKDIYQRHETCLSKHYNGPLFLDSYLR
ncbi:MAG: hypothetical protein D3910_12180 [Candidatus Electrothrix sp. ATG2]|nr:hypothetical protein [Candidatus Electrothrix sp. ATG2]